MIVVFGSLTVDLITPVAQLPAKGETVIGGNYTIAPGGKGANQALAAALGAAGGTRVAMLGTVGRDAWSAIALQRLRAEGVDVTLVDEGQSHTACGFIAVDPQGQTQITVSPGANMETRAGLLDRLPSPLTARDWLILQMEVPLEENWRALDKAKAAGARTVLNLAPAMPIDEATLDKLDILIVNEGEVRLLGNHLNIAEHDPLAIAQALAKRHALTCIATLGEEGSLAVEPNGATWRVACPKVKAIDTTGAGDAYVGYLVAALDAGIRLADAMHFASTGASLSCETRGAQTAYRTRADIARRLTGVR